MNGRPLDSGESAVTNVVFEVAGRRVDWRELCNGADAASGAMLGAIEHYVQERFEGWRCAIVVESALLYGWSKTFTTLRRMLKAPGEMVVFRNIDKACDWLGIEEKDIVPSGPRAA